jgi:ubiquinone/menaquinone biosynthesis C-methylase UbiE
MTKAIYKELIMMDKTIFSELAARYDTPERLALAEIITKKLRPEFHNTTDKSLMDYGSGTGLISLELVDLVQSVLLVDAAKPMLELAEAKIQAKNITKAKTVYADFTQGIPDMKADIILLSLVLLHIQNTEQILKTLHARLNQGGTLLIVDFDKNPAVHHPTVHNGFEHDQLTDLLLKAGYQNPVIENFYSGENLFMRQEATLFLAKATK